MAEKVVLLTGYPPFGNHTINPSGMVAEALNGQVIADYQVHGVVLPCDYKQMPPVLAEYMQQLRPAVVIGTGLAFGESQIRLERVGLNLLNFATPDNGGHLIQNTPILENGPAAYFSNLPLEKLQTRLRQEGIPAYISGHAGGHLCNQMLYTVSHFAAQSGEARPAIGFIHIPALPEQAAAEACRDNLRQCVPSMSLDLMLQSLKIILNFEF